MQKKQITKERKRQLYEEVKPIAQKARDSIMEKNLVIKDSFEILEQQGFFIVGFPAKDNELSGFHVNKEGIHFIYINTGQDLGRQYFSLWHEYYHIYTGEQSNVSLSANRKIDEVEYKAECFAGCILMPDYLVEQYLIENFIDLKRLSQIQLIKMFTYFGVSYNAMLSRLIQLYPMYDNLNMLFGLSTSNKRRKEFVDKIRFNKGNDQLVHPTNKLYISTQFFEDLKYNIENDRISEEKATDIINMLNGMETYSASRN